MLPRHTFDILQAQICARNSFVRTGSDRSPGASLCTSSDTVRSFSSKRSYCRNECVRAPNPQFCSPPPQIMFYGHPVERLCTYQYSLVSLIPGLLQHLDDAGSPPLASRARALSRPTELRTSDRRSLLAYLGLPLDVFGRDAFFQPYLPLQQIDSLKEDVASGWMIGTTNAIVTQAKDTQLLVNVRSTALSLVSLLTVVDRSRPTRSSSATRNWKDLWA